MSNSRLYVGIDRVNGNREVFRTSVKPTAETRPQYSAVIGPFRSRHGAVFMARFGANNPHCQTVADAERLAWSLPDRFRVEAGRLIIDEQTGDRFTLSGCKDPVTCAMLYDPSRLDRLTHELCDWLNDRHARGLPK